MGARYRGTAIVVVLGLVAACSGGEAEASGNNAIATQAGGKPAAAAPASGAPADLAGARVLIDRIYSSYSGNGPDTDGLFTSELETAIERQSDPDGGLGYDVFCQCQDYGDTSYVIDSLVAEPGGAVTQVTFTSFGEPVTVTLRLARRGGTWLVADVRNGESSLLEGGR